MVNKWFYGFIYQLADYDMHSTQKENNKKKKSNKEIGVTLKRDKERIKDPLGPNQNWTHT